MSNIIIAGLINIETTLKVKGFPIEYFPIDFPFYGINSEVSGVGVNIPKALNILGDQVKVVSMIGKDEDGERVKNVFKKEGWGQELLNEELTDTPQSIVLYDPLGKREIYCDLKNIQDKTFDENLLKKALEDCNVAIVCNSNFTRPLLKLAKEKNVLIASDMHVLSDINDEYNKEFMKYADILFLSDEKLPSQPNEFICDLKNAYSSKIIVIGQGDKGAMMYVRDENLIYDIDAVQTRKIVNTVGAGDALFSAFIHYFVKGETPIEALKKAEIFASYKIGDDGAAKGFINDAKIEQYYSELNFKIDKISM